MDKIEASILGIGAFAAIQIANSCTKGKGMLCRSMRSETQLDNRNDSDDMENNEMVTSPNNTSFQNGQNPNNQPGIALNEFISNRYKISFKYPKEWRKNPRYNDKYEGTSGFFEVEDFSGIGENIDEAVKMQINEAYKPYGSNPTIRRFMVDGQPARVIYASDDQSEFFKDREAAIVVQYPQPVIIDDKAFDYVVIWISQEYVPLVLSTFKFLRS